jgi:hypothetical protein
MLAQLATGIVHVIKGYVWNANTFAQVFFPNLREKISPNGCAKVIASRSYDLERLITDLGDAAKHFIEYLLHRGIEAVIPPHQRAKILREYDEWLYRERHLVE